MVLVNSGVLFYCRKSCGELMFLLGQERFIEGYRCSGEWSAFEGGVKEGETEVQAAVRECMEESGGVVMTEEQLKAKISDEAYRVTVAVQDDEDPAVTTDRSLYVVQVPEDDDLPKRFARRRSSLVRLLQMVNQYDELRQQSQRLRLPLIGHEIAGVHIADIYHCHVNTVGELWVHSLGLQKGIVAQRMHMIKVTPEQRKFIGEYRVMIRLWSQIKQLAPKPEAERAFVPVLNNGLVTTYRCNEDCLEKIELRWFTLTDVVRRLRPCRRSVIRLRYKFSILMSFILNHKREMLRATSKPVQPAKC